jgi:hypothetical protein
MLELGQEAERIFPRLPAEFLRGLVGAADRRAIVPAVDTAEMVF